MESGSAEEEAGLEGAELPGDGASAVMSDLSGLLVE